MLSFSVDTRLFFGWITEQECALNLTEPSPGGKATLTGNGFPWLYAQKVRSAVTMGEMGDEILSTLWIDPIEWSRLLRQVQSGRIAANMFKSKKRRILQG